MDVEVKTIKLESFKFTHPKDRLDDFYYKHACISNYKELYFVVRLVLTLSHGQAAVERGFSINNTSVKTNMTPVISLNCKPTKTSHCSYHCIFDQIFSICSPSIHD